MAYLRLARVRRRPPPRWIVVIITIVLAILLGGATGFGFGKLFAQHDRLLPACFALLGAFDGLGIALLFLFALVDGVNQAKQRIHPLVVLLAFCVPAVKVIFALSVPWYFRLLIVFANGLIGLIAALLCRRRIQRHAANHSAIASA